MMCVLCAYITIMYELIYYFNNAPQSKNIRDQQNSNYKMKNNNNSRRILSTSVDNNFNVFIREHEQIDSIFIWIL